MVDTLLSVNSALSASFSFSSSLDFASALILLGIILNSTTIATINRIIKTHPLASPPSQAPK